MVLETAQLLCGAHHALDGPAAAGGAAGPLYRPTHLAHPCAVWARGSSANYAWLARLLGGLLEEYGQRYGRAHACSRFAALPVPRAIRRGGPTPFAQCVPEPYRRADAVEAYRAYYRGEKARLAAWRTGAPAWWAGAA
jgi:hypothetical protein